MPGRRPYLDDALEIPPTEGEPHAGRHRLLALDPAPARAHHGRGDDQAPPLVDAGHAQPEPVRHPRRLGVDADRRPGGHRVGGALIMAATLSILTNVVTDPKERAQAIAMWASVGGLAVASAR